MADLRWIEATHVVLAKDYAVRDVDGTARTELANVKVALSDGFAHIDSGIVGDDGNLYDVRPAAAVLAIAYVKKRSKPGFAGV